MTPPPEQLDNADVFLWAHSESEPFGAVHYSTGGIAHVIHGLAICRYSDSGDLYRFSFNRDWEVVQDAVYQSAEEAMAAAVQLFSTEIHWHSVHSPGAPANDNHRNA